MEYGIVPMSHFDLDIITGLIDIKNSKKPSKRLQLFKLF